MRVSEASPAQTEAARDNWSALAAATVTGARRLAKWRRCAAQKLDSTNTKVIEGVTPARIAGQPEPSTGRLTRSGGLADGATDAFAGAAPGRRADFRPIDRDEQTVNSMKQSERKTETRPRLFVKPGCGWCRQAMTWLDRHGIAYDKLDVIADPKAWDEMVALSGQTLAPVIEVNGRVLADFGEAELAQWWERPES